MNSGFLNEALPKNYKLLAYPNWFENYIQSPARFPLETTERLFNDILHYLFI